jgi:two-component system, OmpR family, sensor histidine kinase VanS
MKNELINKLRNNFNRNRSITKKLFIITAVFFAVFVGSTMIIQSLFFEKFYISKKKSDLISNIESFRADYNKAQDTAAAMEVAAEYEANNNIKIVILDSASRLKLNQSRFRNDGTKTKDLTDFIRLWSEQTSKEMLVDNKTQSYVISNRDSDTRNIVSINYNSVKTEVIFALSSLQPVNEAVGVIEKLYLYFAIAAVLFTIILALIYSRMIAKPLVKINKVASKMAQLDFTEKCEETNQDEIGNVAASLNFLSENLDNALTSLKQANTKLEEDIEKERKLEKMRREFVASVSHELKTPISLIDGYAVGLKDNIFEGEDRDYYLDIIIDESEKMGNLVSDMLDLSYLESGSFKLKREEFNITELIEHTLRKYGSMFEEKKTALELNLFENVAVNADWNRLEQVITNFITNALRHVNEEGTIYVGMSDKDNGISIEVENTGSSIAEEDLIKIWDKFYKVDKARTRKLGGTGIGLSIVKNILLHHEYSFGTENTDRGVRFYFIVPKTTQELTITENKTT